MLRKMILALSLTAIGVFTVSGFTGTEDAPRVFVVEMVDVSATQFAFKPADLAVRPGDVVRFVQTGIQPHNVEFRNPPAGASLGGLTMGPFLLKKGDTYDVTIDDRFASGDYPYVCTPHEPMGMKGTLTVER